MAARLLAGLGMQGSQIVAEPPASADIAGGSIKIALQVGPAVLQVAHQLLDMKRRAGAPRSLLSAMLERSLVKLLKLLRELLAVHPWSAPPLRAG